MKIGLKQTLGFLVSILLMGIACNLLVAWLHHAVEPLTVEMAQSVEKANLSFSEHYRVLLVKIVQHFQYSEWLTLLFGLLSLVLGLATSLWVVRSILKRIQGLKKSMDIISEGNLDAKIDIQGSDEISELAQGFEKMVETVKRSMTSANHMSHELADRQSAQEHLAEQNRFLETILESLTYPLVVIDAHNYKVVKANAAASVGRRDGDEACYALAERRGTPCSGGYLCPLLEVKRKKKPVIVEHSHTDQFGNELVLEVHGFPILDADGSVSHMVEYFIDITERKRAEAKTRHLQAQLFEGQKMENIGTMATGVAHSFNNVLGVIRGYTEMALLEVPEDSQANDDLHQVVKNIESAKELADKMLVFSHKQEPVLKLVEMQEVLNQAVELFRTSKTTRVKVSLTMDPLPKKVMADFRQLQQALLQLWNNSYQAMDGSNGYIEVQLEEVMVDDALIEAYPNLEPGPHVHLSITDTGQGMDTETLARVFEPFFTTKEVGNGAGLGLAIVHGVIINHRGDISVASEPGNGARFDIYLPLAKETVKKM